MQGLGLQPVYIDETGPLRRNVCAAVQSAIDYILYLPSLLRDFFPQRISSIALMLRSLASFILAGQYLAQAQSSNITFSSDLINPLTQSTTNPSDSIRRKT